MQTNGVSLDSMVVIRKAELMQDTWSPMLKVMEEEGAFSFRELLRLSLIESDNNACDLLFQLFGMPEKVESFVEGLGLCMIARHWRWRTVVLHRKWPACCYGSTDITIAVFVPHPNSPNELAEIVKTSLE